MSLLAWLRATGFATASLMLAAQGLPPAAAQSPKGTGANAAGTGANAAGTGTALPAAQFHVRGIFRPSGNAPRVSESAFPEQ